MLELCGSDDDVYPRLPIDHGSTDGLDPATAMVYDAYKRGAVWEFGSTLYCCEDPTAVAPRSERQAAEQADYALELEGDTKVHVIAKQTLFDLLDMFDTEPQAQRCCLQ